MLLTNQFKAHMIALVMNALTALNTIVLLTQTGHTEKLQVLDAGISIPFKTYNRHEF